MRIDLKKLAKVEKEYRYDNPVCQNSLQSMLDIILANTGNKPESLPLNYIIAYETLTGLGVLVDEKVKEKPQQLNS